MRDQLASFADSASYAPSLVKRVDDTIEVFCDGVRLPLAFAYSIELGYAETFVEDPAGGVQRDGLTQSLKTKRVEGKIEVRVNDDDYASIARNIPRRRVGAGRHARVAAHPAGIGLRRDLSRDR